MANLDDLKAIEKIDQQKMAEHIAALPDQISAAAKTFKQISVPSHYIQAKNVLILGMGGSAIGGELAAALANATSTVPIEVRRDYGLPGYVGKDTLVIGVSYSGNTEETLDGFQRAAAKGAKLIAVTGGGTLGSLARKFQIPIYPIDYGAQPRAAFGYLFAAAITILGKLRFVQLGENELEESAVLMKAMVAKLEPSVPTTQNQAKQLAAKLKDKIPVVIGNGPMAIVARRWKTQLNENSKLPAVFETMPELCHNVVIGMEKVYPQRDVLFPIILNSAFTHPRNQLRLNIISKQWTSSKLSMENIMIQPSGTPISEVLQMVQLGDYVSLYAGLQVGANPTTIDSINKLKEELEANTWESGK